MLALDKYYPFRCNNDLGGPGYIAGEPPGIVTVAGVPAMRRVRIFNSATGVPIADTFSGADGTYRINALSPDLVLHVLGIDYTGAYPDIVISGVRPYHPPIITTADITGMAQGVSFSAPLTTKYGYGALTFTATGMPPGIDINPSTGTIYGTPSAAGPYTIEVEVTDAEFEMSARTFEVVVAP